MRKIEDVILKDGRNLKEVLELHKKWLECEEDGKRAYLSDEDLSNVNLSNLNLRYVILEGVNLSDSELSYVNLRGVYLRGADLECANLRGADLTGANLRGADLTGANLRGADLESANLRGAYLSYADLTDANLTKASLTDANLTKASLTDANLEGIKYNNTTTSFALQCPEEGSFIGYKKANDKIVKLLITEDAKRSSATTRKCRCNKAKVLSITSLDGKENFEKVNSNYDFDFVYEVGKIVEVENFDNDRWNECAPGIHFFITRDEAVMY